MTRIVVQRTVGRARRLALIAVLVVTLFGGLSGCGRRVRLAPDVRVRPCGAVVDVAGTSLERSTVSWASPDDVGHRAKLDAWCNTVGPIVVHRAQSGRPVVGRLVVIGWNVHLGAGDVLRLVDDLRAGRLGAHLTGAAIALILQESFRAGALVPGLMNGAPVPDRIAPHGPTPRRGALDIATTLGLNLYYLPMMRNGRADIGEDEEDRGLAVLSSLPLTDLQAIELPLERQRRLAAASTVRIDPSSGDPLNLRLINLHLETRGRGRHVWLGSPQVRNRQVEALTASLTRDVPTLIEGDLNTWANHEPVLQTLTREFTPCTDGRPTFGGGLHLDTFFARLPAGWKLTCRRLDQKYGSDHYPIVAVLEKRPD
jgi:endonuclease/exonuclease/phosphatase family metal-dependent hydrolase